MFCADNQHLERMRPRQLNILPSRRLQIFIHANGKIITSDDMPNEMMRGMTQTLKLQKKCWLYFSSNYFRPDKKLLAFSLQPLLKSFL